MKEDSIIRDEKLVLNEHVKLQSLDTRYKRVIDELRKQLKWWQSNAWKATFIIIMNKILRREAK